jgi:hypothetical protein
MARKDQRQRFRSRTPPARGACGRRRARRARRSAGLAVWHARSPPRSPAAAACTTRGRSRRRRTRRARRRSTSTLRAARRSPQPLRRPRDRGGSPSDCHSSARGWQLMPDRGVVVEPQLPTPQSPAA